MNKWIWIFLIVFMTQEAFSVEVKSSSTVSEMPTGLNASLVSTLPALNTAPLIPLEPQFPLGLTQANRERFIDNSDQQKQAAAYLQHELRQRAFPWLALVLIFGFGSLGWVAYIMRDRWFKSFSKDLEIISPQEQITEALQALQDCRFDPEHNSACYVQISSILSKVLQAHLGWKVEEMTSEEFGAALQKEPSPFSKEQKEKMIGFYQAIDQVKFAGKKTNEAEALHLSMRIREFIKQLI